VTLCWKHFCYCGVYSTADGTTDGVGIIFDNSVLVYVDLSSGTNSSITRPDTLLFSDSQFSNVTALTGDYRNRQFYVVRQHQPPYYGSERGSILVVTIPADINEEWPTQEFYFNQYTPTVFRLINVDNVIKILTREQQSKTCPLLSSKEGCRGIVDRQSNVGVLVT
jgi:hypothetical protein